MQSQTFLQISGKLFANNQNFGYLHLYKVIDLKLGHVPQNWDSGGHFVFVIFFIFANIQNFSKVGQATKSLELGSKKTLQLFITSFIFANNKKFQKIRLD